MWDDKNSNYTITIQYTTHAQVLLAINIDAGGGPETRMSLGVALAKLFVGLSGLQTYQLSRIERETHDFSLHLTLSRLAISFSHITAVASNPGTYKRPGFEATNTVACSTRFASG